VPLRLFSLEGRYATALYSAGVKKGTLDTVETEMGKIKGVIAKSADLQTFLRDPSCSRDQKSGTVLSMLKKQNYSETVINFFRTVAENGRLAQASKMIDSFEEIMRAHRREVSVKITSAKELERGVVDTIKNSVVTRFLEQGQIPKVSVIVDTKIMGGLIVEIGDKTIDLSVATRVAALNKSLEESIYQ
jgi:F-type H+-transporting ATPase subunit O